MAVNLVTFGDNAQEDHVLLPTGKWIGRKGQSIRGTPVESDSTGEETLDGVSTPHGDGNQQCANVGT